MELLEYQAKELFRTVGIPTLPAQTVKDARKIKQLQIPYPVVLKSQVRSGGRGKAGGVRFVANTIDAIAAARSIFNLSILGEYPEVILAEAHYNAEQELFLAIVLDYDLKCPVLLGSPWGGMNVDSLLDSLQAVPVEGTFSTFYARHLASNMGLTGNLICSVSDIVGKMYHLFREQDLDLIEINPLGVNAKGELMALDGKITINNYALGRQPILGSCAKQPLQIDQLINNQSNAEPSQVSWRFLDWHHKTGKVAMICNSFDGALLTWDLLKQTKITPASSILLENNSSAGLMNNDAEILVSYRTQLREILAELKFHQGIKAIVLNIWEPEAISREIVNTIIDYCSEIKDLAVDSPAATSLVNSSATTCNQGWESRQSAKLAKTSEALPYFVLRLLDQAILDDLTLPEEVYLSDSLEKVINYTGQKIRGAR